MGGGQEHSRLPVDDGLEGAEAMELFEQGALPVRLLWSHEELDAALSRYGWVRAGSWSYGQTAEVTCLLCSGISCAA